MLLYLTNTVCLCTILGGGICDNAVTNAKEIQILLSSPYQEIWLYMMIILCDRKFGSVWSNQ